ncbi:hypothetical protein TWF106_004563 [Orbilia oligospora]|uniref:Cytochrome P450 n=1 Tax=Orbilia oligospora TaxID=2813651 RepID=A0A6G1LY98_ORBOL|nr:hypothetical protein TWF106_004563 [Orbilia oligospora]KAF3238220.1 hypothetical protein TWF192_010636 [Orbilia oligospora]
MPCKESKPGAFQMDLNLCLFLAISGQFSSSRYTPVILINDPAAAYELLQKGALNSSSRPLNNDYRYSILPNRIVVTPAGKCFRDLRKLYHMLLQEQAATIYQAHDVESATFLQALVNEPSNFRLECERLALNVLLKPIYGCRAGKIQDNLVKELYDIWEMMYLYFLPWTFPFDNFPSLLALPKILQPWDWLTRSLLRQEELIHARLLGGVKASMETSEGSPCMARTLIESDMLGHVLGLKINRTDDGKLSKQAEERNLTDVLAMILGAGADTISSTLLNFFKAMALHHNAMALSQADAVVGSDRLPAWGDMDDLPYTKALIKEVHRWAPIATIGVPHATTSRIEYRGYIIPEGTILVPNIASLSRCESLFREPNMFEPCRYLGVGDKKLVGLPNQGDHFQYGFGRRLCPGSHIAESCLSIVIARVLWGFNIRKVPGHEIDMDHRRNGLLRKAKPFDISISSRGESYEKIIMHAGGGINETA